VLPTHEPVDFGTDFRQIAKVEIDTGKTDIGDLINVGKVIEYQVANQFALYFSTIQPMQGVFYLMNDIFDGIRADGAFHGCDAYACQQLLAIEGLPAPISFDHQQARSSVFIGGKSLAAFLALPATANSVSGIAGIDYFVLVMAAMWAIHNPLTSGFELCFDLNRVGMPVKPRFVRIFGIHLFLSPIKRIFPSF
jgi:hypothetical protein